MFIDVYKWLKKNIFQEIHRALSVSLSCSWSSITTVFYQQFQENEKRRYEAEKKRAEQKHQRKLEELQAASEYTVKELEQLQNEKREYSTSTLILLLTVSNIAMEMQWPDNNWSSYFCLYW